ncbi:MAG: flippase-like domain-containing protein [Actinomycetota bacterium]|nr:flippase-like domain-containing protein [Actinomycetota bacterium]
MATSPAGGRVDHSVLWRRGVTLTLLILAAVGALFAVPDLRPVVSEIGDMNPWLVGAAIALELGSCASFTLIFRVFFSPLDRPVAHELAWVQMGSGALIPGGGAGSLAVGGWLLHLAGMPTRQIVQRSSGLFFLTSAINVLSLGAAGLILLLGIGDGPHDAARAGLPVLVAAGAIILVLAMAPLSRRLSRGHDHTAWIEDVGVGVPAARRALLHPSWRLSGAIGYLLFDIAVLWVTLAAVGPAPPVAALVIAYLVGYLANAIPVPGGIGVLDAGLVGALAIYGLPLTHAAAAVLVYHAIAFWIPTLGGTIAYLPLRNRLLTSAPSTEDRHRQEDAGSAASGSRGELVFKPKAGA